jgi:hypothetical protein
MAGGTASPGGRQDTARHRCGVLRSRYLGLGEYGCRDRRSNPQADVGNLIGYPLELSHWDTLPRPEWGTTDVTTTMPSLVSIRAGTELNPGWAMCGAGPIHLCSRTRAAPAW